MMNTNHVNGMTVVSIGTGERLGSVPEILLDPAAEHVAAFAISRDLLHAFESAGISLAPGTSPSGPSGQET